MAWGIFIVSVVCRSALSTGIALALWGILPNLVGFQTTVVMSGSMSPRLEVGDAVVVRHITADKLAPGQVLLFDDPDERGRLRMHRVVSMNAKGITTRGDANAVADSSPVAYSAVKGAGFLRIPFGGLPEYWIRTGQPVPLVVTGAVALLLLAGVRLDALLDNPEDRQRRRHRGTKAPPRRRAVAASVAVIALCGAAAIPGQPTSASASYLATTDDRTNTWTSLCGDATPSTGATPSLYYGYGPASGSDVTDLSSSGDTGTFRPGASRTTSCSTTGWSPYATFNGTSGVVTASKSRNHPTALTIATWFKVAPGDAGGVLADFGNQAGTGTSGGVDDALYMSDTGSLTFASASVQAIGLIMTAYKYCTAPGNYADGKWHLVVATLSTAAPAGCAITMDATAATTVTVPYNLSVSLGAYSGYWRFGYDSVSGGTNAPSRFFFKGALDETQIYDSAVPFSVQTTIWNKGHGGSANLP